MTKRPLPPVQGMPPIERGVGPVAKTAPPAEAALAEEQQPAAKAPPAGPDGTFSSAKNPAAAELVPTGSTAPAPVDSTPPDRPDDPAGQEPQQGPVYTFSRPDVPRAEEILQPRPKIEREQISHMVPAELRLVRRMRLFWAAEGMEQRDQVAHALDQWLRARGF